MKQQFIDSITALIRYKESDIELNREKLSENYTYYLPWTAKEIFCDSIRVSEWKRWLTRLDDINDLNYLLHSEFEAYGKWLSSPSNVCIESTNAISELCVTWKYQVILELHKDLQILKGGDK